MTDLSLKLLALDETAVVTILLIVIHLGGRELRRAVVRRETQLGSFGSGMAVAYIFLHLLSELDSGHALLGERVHFVVLLGFLAYYGVEHFLETRLSEDMPQASRQLRFGLAVAIAWLYNWLIVYALPEAIVENGVRMVPAVAALLLHVLFNDVHMARTYPAEFDRWGRWLLASAPLVGWITDLFFFTTNPLVEDVLVALLAGSILYNVLKRELPEHRATSFRWFLIGVLCFCALDLPSWD